MSANAENWKPSERVEVDPDAVDAATAIERHKEGLPPPESGDKLDFSTERKNFRKRFSRLERQFTQKQGEADARHQRELSDLHKKIDALSVSRGDTVDTDQQKHDAKIAQMTKDLAAAFESGDSNKAASIQAQMTRAENEFWHNKTVTMMQGSQARKPGEKPEREAEQEQRPTVAKPSDAALAWRKANEEWYLDEDYAPEMAYTNMLYKQAQDEGEEDSPELFARINARLRKKFPDLAGKIKAPRIASFEEEDEDPAPRRRRAPVPGTEDRGEDTPRNRGKRVHFSDSDLEMMRSFGVDTSGATPASQKAMQRWAQERRQLEAAEH